MEERSLDMKGSCEYIEKLVADSRKGGGLPVCGLGEVLTTSHLKQLPCYEIFKEASSRDFVNEAMNLWFPCSARKFLSSLERISFSGITLLYGVSWSRFSASCMDA